MAIGVFDGLHRGHQELLNQIIDFARLNNGQAVVMTFDPHPFQVIHPSEKIPLIDSLDYRIQLLQDYGVDGVVVVPFTKRFSQLKPEIFIRRYIVEPFHPQAVFVGNDFMFGANRAGSSAKFTEAGQKHHFIFKALEQVKTQGHKISSTRIRELIRQGKLSQAEKLLGRRVGYMGKVVHGDSRGKSLGYPTANIDFQNVVIPPLGVYAVQVRVGKKTYPGMGYIGRRPTYEKANHHLNMEVNIFDFKERLYDKPIIVELVKRTRGEKAFSSEGKLLQQIKRDEENIRTILKNI